MSELQTAHIVITVTALHYITISMCYHFVQQSFHWPRRSSYSLDL